MQPAAFRNPSRRDSTASNNVTNAASSIIRWSSPTATNRSCGRPLFRSSSRLSSIGTRSSCGE